MFDGLIGSVAALLDDLRHAQRPARAVAGAPYAPLERVRLTDGVGRTLFEQYATHRAAARGEDETGWLLLGLRDQREAIAVAALPAGASADAGVAHVRFNSTAQAVACRVVRRADRRLTVLGVVHTHPGSLRHPSPGDLRGDRQWVGHLRGGEGVFGIGTADGPPDAAFAVQPHPNVQCLGGLRFSWYALRQGGSGYRALPIEWTLGSDLAAGLHGAWPALEVHAERLERLCQQQAGARVEPTQTAEGPALLVTIPLARRGSSVRVLLNVQRQVRYLVEREGTVTDSDLDDPLVDRGVYRLLAELARDG
jgi:proteasome lid subunit RPN8/RPN11